jgi:hypothetical protein
VTEEVWSWRLASGEGGKRSIHMAPWPSLDESADVPAPERVETFAAAAEVLGKIRGTKSEAHKSLKWPVSELEIVGTEGAIAALQPVFADVLRAGCVEPDAARTAEGAAPEGQRFGVKVVLAEGA